MNYNVGEVMSARVHAVKLDVSHVRQPGDRMPVACIKRGKGPNNIFACYAVCHMKVVRHVFIIVETHERVISHLRVYGYSNDNNCYDN